MVFRPWKNIPKCRAIHKLDRVVTQAPNYNLKEVYRDLAKNLPGGKLED